MSFYVALSHDVHNAIAVHVVQQHKHIHMQNGSPFEVVTLDITDLNIRRKGLCYTEQEAAEKYGLDEGKVFGDDVQICGQKLPTRRALKFMKLSGKKVAHIFDTLSFEEKHALKVGSAVLPEDVMQESLSQYWRGSGINRCNGCETEPQGTVHDTIHPGPLMHSQHYCMFSGDENFGVCGMC